MSEYSKREIMIVTYHGQLGNHIAKISEAIQRNPLSLGTVTHLNVAHDDWCDLLAGAGPCNCNPEVKILGMGHCDKHWHPSSSTGNY